MSRKVSTVGIVESNVYDQDIVSAIVSAAVPEGSIALVLPPYATRVEVVESTLREYTLRLRAGDAVEYVSSLYSNFVNDGQRPPGGKTKAFSFEMRSYTAAHPRQRIAKCEQCDGVGDRELTKGVREICPCCEGSGGVVTRPATSEETKTLKIE